jgi:hypothetical protein
MNRALVLSIGVIVGLTVLVFWFIGGRHSQTAISGTQPVGLPVANSVGNSTDTTVPTGVTSATSSLGSTISISTVSGGVIQTSNFISDPATAKDPVNTGYYYLGYHVNEGAPDATATSTPPYIIEYIAPTEYFNIALLQEPIGSVRGEAEQYLMAHLGISESQMCQLNYMVSVPDSVNDYYASQNLGFSFCPGAVTLPQ